MSSIQRLCEQKKAIVVCGTGGVGKTTISSAIAIVGALQGKRTLVITIDPAKRLATSLGFEKWEEETKDLTPLLRKIAKIPENGGMFATIPDTHKTLENFFSAISPYKGVTEKLLNSQIFKVLSRDFSGANEYMALQRLLSAIDSSRYDLIVLDTPPSRNTLYFFSAPKLLSRLFQEKLIRWIIAPSGFLGAALQTGMKKALQTLENLTGKGFISDLLEFVRNIFETEKLFTEKLDRISKFLNSKAVGFVFVTSSSPENHLDSEAFLRSLNKQNLQCDAVVLNRCLGPLTAAEPQISTKKWTEARAIVQYQQNLEQETVKWVAHLLHLHQDSRSGDESARSLVQVPEFVRDIHKLEDLVHVARCLDGSSSTSVSKGILGHT